jgi:hypothetical protein
VKGKHQSVIQLCETLLSAENSKNQRLHAVAWQPCFPTTFGFAVGLLFIFNNYCSTED